jgi:hypothetical protein
LLTLILCKWEGRPYVVIDASKTSESAAAADIARLVDEHDIHALNVAGPRLSGWADGHGFAARTVGELIVRCRGRAAP